MRILVISRNAWDDTNSIGNTLSNFLGGISNAEFASLYFRSAKPNNCLCKKYYHTSEIEVLRNWFKPNDIGRSFDLTENENNVQKESKREKVLVNTIRKYGLKIAYKLSDYLWYSGKWKNQKLDKFIADFDPDLVVTFAKSAPQYYLTVKHLREKYNIPIFTWIADDEYTALSKRNAEKEIDNLRYILKESAVVTGCSEEICEYYNSVFACGATPLYKGCDLSTSLKSIVNDTVTVVYAGNLLYGRKEIVCRVSDTIEKIAEHGIDVCFEIYSNTDMSDKDIDVRFGNKRCTRYMGKRDYAFVKERLADADVVLHAESFDEDQVLKTKYSFSTKIVDYLQCGGVILAVGPEEIASVKYITKIPGSCVVENLDFLLDRLMTLLSDRSDLNNRARSTRAFAKQYHDSAVISRNLTDIFRKIIEGGV